MSYDVAITKAVFVFFKCFGQLYGIIPFSSKALTFERSRLMLWYSRTIALLLMVIYPWAYVILLTDHEFPILALSYYLVMLQFTLNYIIVVVLYLQVLFDPSSLLTVFNELMERSRAVLRHTYTIGEFPVGRRLLFKAIAIDLVQSFTWYGTYLWLQRRFGLTYALAFWLNSIAVMQIVAVSNVLLAVLLWGSFLYRLINERVRTIIGNLLQMEDIGRQLQDERLFNCNHIYVQLGILRTHHSALTQCIQNIVQFYNVPLVLLMLYQFLIIISEFIMLYDHLTLFVLRIHFHTAQLLGFFPLTYNKQFKQFRVSKNLTFWSYGLALTLGCVYPYVYVILMTGIRYPNLTLVNYLVWLQCSLHYVTILLAYYHLIPSRAMICDIFNDFVHLFRSLNNHYRTKGPTTKRNVLKNALKIILSDTLFCGLFAIYFGQFFTNDDILSEILWMLNTLAVWQSVILTNLIVVMLNISVHFYEMLNHHILLYIQQIPLSSMRLKSCKCLTYEVLRSLKRNHRLVTSNVKSFIHLLRFPMACLLLIHFALIISEIFYAYTSIVQDIKNDYDVPLGTYMSSILFAVFEAVQFYYIVSASSEITEEAEKTGVLLNEFLPTDPNPRVERCIESFTIELLHEDFKINNCGMYDVDYTLMFSVGTNISLESSTDTYTFFSTTFQMIATITSYLIMLVQFQLAEI
uniref:Gustatory receptor n=1 Tax=Anopheles christyi TaxID=43041 RepID=A0A182JXJ3_9DIPT